jgi:type IV secretion system protein VirB3
MHEQEESITLDPLFVGMTRPASALGVPYGALVVEGVFIVLIFLLTSNPLYLLHILPIHAILVLVSAHDPGVFGSTWIWLQTTARRRNLEIWGRVTSVAPVSGERLSK